MNSSAEIKLTLAEFPAKIKDCIAVASVLFSVVILFDHLPVLALLHFRKTALARTSQIGALVQLEEPHLISHLSCLGFISGSAALPFASQGIPEGFMSWHHLDRLAFLLHSSLPGVRSYLRVSWHGTILWDLPQTQALSTIARQCMVQLP